MEATKYDRLLDYFQIGTEVFDNEIFCFPKKIIENITPTLVAMFLTVKSCLAILVESHLRTTFTKLFSNRAMSFFTRRF